jgi:hypothetical protein
MAEDVGALQIRLQATAARFEADMQRATRSMERATGRMEKRAAGLDKRLSDVGSRFGVKIPTGAMAITAAVAAATGAVALLRRELGRLDEIGKTADKLGVTVEGLQELRVAADLSGASSETLSAALRRLSLNIGEANNGNKKAAEAFRNLGVSITDAEGRARPTEAVFRDVAEQVSKIGSTSERTRVLVELFGKQGAELGPMFAKGAKGIDEMTARAREMGLVVGNDSVRAAEALKDEIDLLTRSIGVGLTKAAGEAAKALNFLFNIGAANQARELESRIDSYARQIVETDQRLASQLAGISDPAAQERVRAAFAARRPEMAARLRGMQMELAERRKAIEAGNAMPPGLPSPMGEDQAGGGRGGGSSATSRMTDDTEEAIKRLREMTAGLYNQKAALNMSAREQAIFSAELEAFAVGADLSSEKLSDLRLEYIAAAEALFDMKEAQDAASRAQEDARRFADQLISGFSQAAQQADSFKDALKRLGIQLLEVAARGAFLKEGPFAKLGEAIAPALGSLFGGTAAAAPAIPGRASGGPVSAGRPYIVGEKRPELFVPRTAGTIVPRVPRGGGGPNVSISVDARGANDPGMVEAAARRGAAEALATLQAGPGFARMVRSAQARRG